MKIYFDENFSPHFINGLKQIQAARENEGIEVLSIKEEFGAATPDEKWIPEIAQQQGIVVTQDTNIRRLKSQRSLVKDYSLGLFFIQPAKKGWDYWKIVLLVVKLWPELKELSKKKRRDKSVGYKATATKPKWAPLNG